MSPVLGNDPLQPTDKISGAVRRLIDDIFSAELSYLQFSAMQNSGFVGNNSRAGIKPLQELIDKFGKTTVWNDLEEEDLSSIEFLISTSVEKYKSKIQAYGVFIGSSIGAVERLIPQMKALLSLFKEKELPRVSTNIFTANTSITVQCEGLTVTGIVLSFNRPTGELVIKIEDSQEKE